MSKRRLCSLVLFAALACGGEAPTTGPTQNSSGRKSTPQAGPGLTVTRVDLGTLGGASSFATDVNNSGVVVGWSLNANGVSRAFKWITEGGMTDLGTLPDHDWSRAVSINEGGDILGLSGENESGTSTPVIWTKSGISELPIPLLPNASFGEPTDFNQEGEVVGWDVVGFQHAWIWTSTRGKHDITANAPAPGAEGIASQINSSGLVAGTNKAASCSGFTECWRGFVWSFTHGYADIGTPGADPNVAVTTLGLNNLGTLVGWTMDNSLLMRPYRWSADGGFTMLQVATAPGYAMSLNDNRIAVGASWSVANGALQPTAWERSGTEIPLSASTPFPGVAVAVSEAGWVVGWVSLDCCGGETRATLWRLEQGASVQAAAQSAHSVPRIVAPVETGSPMCLADASALISRAALFACVARKTGATN